MNKILVHAYGDFPVFFKYVIEKAMTAYDSIEWYAIVPGYHHLKLYIELLGKDKVLYLNDMLSKYMQDTLDLSYLSAYKNSIHKAIESDKFSFKVSRSSDWQMRNAASIYRIYKEFILKVKPTHILFPQIETHEGIILKDIAEELGIECIFYCHARNLGESYFSNKFNEKLPPYYYINQELLTKSESFIQDFRKQQAKISIKKEKVNCEDKMLSVDKKSIFKRVYNFIISLKNEPNQRFLMALRPRILNNIPFMRDIIWSLREWKNSKYFHISELNQLPSKYIFYPIQYTPESSINVPAPFYIDQMRAIDAIRLNMPNDTLLVVKEHPSCIKTRKGTLLKSLLKKSGVVIAYYKMPTRELIKNSMLTISVTGTATLEALLLGKPSLTIGENFISEFLGGPCGIDEMSKRIQYAILNPPDDEHIIHSIAKIFSVCNEFILAPSYAEGSGVMLESNVNIFLESLVKHIENMKLYRGNI